MANTAQARKRARQGERNRIRNVAMRSQMRTFIKKVRAALQTGGKDAAQDALNKAAPIIDRMARKGIIHKNAAARYKSRLNAAVKSL